MARRRVNVAQDHLERLSKVTPSSAIEELIWNGLDAGGPRVEVAFEAGSVGGVEAIEVTDLGTGINADDLDRAFGTVGNSLKLQRRQTPEGRAVHGSKGEGRFKALALGSRVTWSTVCKANGRSLRHCITLVRQNSTHYETSELEEVEGEQTGTVVRIEGTDQNVESLLAPTAREQLTPRFALYLTQYPATEIVYDGKMIEIEPLIDHSADYELEPITTGSTRPMLTVIEWKFQPPGKRLLLCGADGFTRMDVEAGIHARGYAFTAYLRASEVDELHRANRLLEMDETVAELVRAAKEKLREHFRARQAGEATKVVEQWKKEKVYPYSEEEIQSPLKKAEAQVFDIVAVRVNEYHAPFREGDSSSRHLTLRLVRQALESNPASLRRILAEVLRLPRRLQDELAELLERTRLEAIIEAARTVTQRLDTIRGFEELLFAKDWKKRLRERTQLHRLLVHELWVFGEEYTLDADDESLTEVLRQHIKRLGREELAPEARVKTIRGTDGIPDLMLSRRLSRPKKRYEHLVVELKRPSVKLGKDQIAQIEDYGFAVMEDERFSKRDVTWTFWLVGNALDAFGRRRAESQGLPYGCVHQEGDASIWVKPWNEILHEARARYEFFRERLDVEASGEKGLGYLKEHYQELLTGRGRSKSQESGRKRARKSSRRVKRGKR